VQKFHLSKVHLALGSNGSNGSRLGIPDQLAPLIFGQ
jgi:hypothetical protein